MIRSLAIAGLLLVSTPVIAGAEPQQTSEPIRTEINLEAPALARTERVIKASPSAVWAVLTDVDAWTDWMPEFASARLDGPLAPGTTLIWKPQGQKVRSRLVVVEAERRLVWNGTDGAVHVFELIPTKEGTLFRNDESIDNWKLGAEQKDAGAFLTESLTVWSQRIAERAERRSN